MPTKTIPDKLTGELVEQGLTDREIVAHLRRSRGIRVTRQGVAAWRKRRGYPVRKILRTTPWELPEQQYSAEPARAIRWFARREAGLPLSSEERRRLEKAEATLAEHDAVFHWDDEEGWMMVRRRPGIDTGLHRVPDAAA